MVVRAKIGKNLGALALGALAFAHVPASAQMERSSPVPRYHLLQLSVDASKIDVADFRAQTETIRSCGDALGLAKSLDAKVTRNRFINSTRLPDELRDRIADMPVGHATPVFGKTDQVLRVLVLCARA